MGDGRMHSPVRRAHPGGPHARRFSPSAPNAECIQKNAAKSCFAAFFDLHQFFFFFTLSRTFGGMCFISSAATVPVAAPVAMAISTSTPI